MSPEITENLPRQVVTNCDRIRLTRASSVAKVCWYSRKTRYGRAEVQNQCSRAAD